MTQEEYLGYINCDCCDFCKLHCCCDYQCPEEREFKECQEEECVICIWDREEKFD